VLVGVLRQLLLLLLLLVEQVALEMRLSSSSSSKLSQQLKQQQQRTRQQVKQQQLVTHQPGQQVPAAVGSRGCRMARFCPLAVLNMNGCLWWAWCTLETA
jgi:hypothetical protein